MQNFDSAALSSRPLSKYSFYEIIDATRIPPRPLVPRTLDFDQTMRDFEGSTAGLAQAASLLGARGMRLGSISHGDLSSTFVQLLLLLEVEESTTTSSSNSYRSEYTLDLLLLLLFFSII